jgi:hypothetical protein
MLGSLALGLVLCTSALAILALLETPGRNPPPSVETQEFLLLIIRWFSYGILPTVGLAFLLTAHTLWRHRRLSRAPTVV